MESDGPPERAGAPEAEAEDHGSETGGEQADGGFSRVVAVAEAEEDGKDEGRGPEAERGAVASLERPFVDAGEAAGQSVLEVAASEVLLEQANHEEAEEPECAVTDCSRAEEETAVDDEEAGLPEGEDEEGETGDSPGEAGEEVGEFACAAEAVDGVGATLDLRHDPREKEDHGEGDRLVDECGGEAECAGGAWVLVRGGVKLVADDVHGKHHHGKERDEDGEAPAGAEAVCADEDVAESGWARRGAWLYGSERGIVVR